MKIERSFVMLTPSASVWPSKEKEYFFPKQSNSVCLPSLLIEAIKWLGRLRQHVYAISNVLRQSLIVIHWTVVFYPDS